MENKEVEFAELQTTLLQIYQKNLQHLKVHHEKLFERLEEFSQKLEAGEIKEKYSLEYMDGYFNILDHETDKLFYPISSYLDADIRAIASNFTKEGSLDLLRKVPGSNKLIFHELYSEVMPIIHYINEVVDLDNIEFEKIYKMIFIGTGLGLHLQEIDKKLKPYTTLIIEPEMEIFRLSLFVTDYTVFDEGNRKLFLSVEEGKNARNLAINNFAHHHEYMNFNIKHYNYSEKNQYIKDEVVEYFGLNSVLNFPYRAIINILHQSVKFMANKERYLSTLESRRKLILKDKPILLISAGPSLDGYMDWIEEHQEKFLIICVDVIVRKLEKHNIVPDIAVTIDPSSECEKFFKTEDEEFLKDSIIIALSQQDDLTYDIIKKSNLYFSQGLPIVHKLGFPGSVSNVGTYAFLSAAILGGSEMYLIGNDAAFNQETGSRYAADSSHSQMEDTDKESLDNVFDWHDVVEVKGNLRDTVKTTNSLLTFRNDYEKTLHLMEIEDEFEFHVYNMSDGVYMEGLEPITRDQMDQVVEKLPNKKHDLVDQFNMVSEVLTDDDLDYSESIKAINKVIAKVKKFREKKFVDKTDLLDQKLLLMAWILESLKEPKSLVLANIFMKYYALSDIYINFLLNLRQEGLYKGKALESIASVWGHGVEQLFKDMKKAIK